ncbi:MAG: hypothetical protein R3229_17760, partial [Alphaproteobacteria bacterium]|nr:hypothetical protein [Alphaproteobacteria bacterium]
MPRYLTLFRVVFALILAMTSICQQAAADQKSVGVSYSRTLSTVSENTVRLGDLFTNTGGKSDTIVDQAPPPGGEAIYDVHRLASIARAHGLVWQAQSWSERVV